MRDNPSILFQKESNLKILTRKKQEKIVSRLIALAMIEHDLFVYGDCLDMQKKIDEHEQFADNITDAVGAVAGIDGLAELCEVDLFINAIHNQEKISKY